MRGVPPSKLPPFPGRDVLIEAEKKGKIGSEITGINVPIEIYIMGLAAIIEDLRADVKQLKED